jgi:hypothetical protein
MAVRGCGAFVVRHFAIVTFAVSNERFMKPAVRGYFFIIRLLFGIEEDQ